MSTLIHPARIDQSFLNYVGASQDAIHTVAYVQWNDPQQLYKRQVHYVKNDATMARFGYRPTNIVAVGCTSRGQAERVGRWILLSEQFRSETCTWRTGLEGVRGAPGDIVDVADANRAGVRLGGRCLAGSTTTSINLDAPVTLDPADSYTLSVILPGADIETPGSGMASAPVSVPESTTETDTLTLSTALAAAPAPGAVWLLKSDAVEPQSFYLTSVNEAEKNIYEMSGLKYVDLSDAIETGIAVEESPISLFVPPATPQNLTLREASHSSGSAVALSISFGWDSVPGAAGYLVTWRRNDDNPMQLPRQSAPLADVPLGKVGTYNLSVAAVNQAGMQSAPAEASAAFDGTTLIVLAAPVLTAVGTADGIDLAWPAVDNADHYRAERSASGSGGWAAVAQNVQTQHWRDPITDGAQWSYRLIAVDHFGGESEPSNVATATAKTSEDGATAGADWATNLTGGPRNLQNLIFKPSFEDGEIGDWVRNPQSDLSVIAVTGQPFTKGLRAIASTTAFDFKEKQKIPVVPGQRVFRAGWLNTANSSVGAGAVVAFEDADGVGINWPGAVLAAGSGWQLVRSIIIVPAGAAFMLPAYINWHPAAGDKILIGPQDTSLYASEVYRLEGGPNLGAGAFSGYFDSYSFTVTADAITWSGGTLNYQGATIGYSSHTWSGLDAATKYWLGLDDIDLDGTPEQWLISGGAFGGDSRMLSASPNRIGVIGPESDWSVETKDSGGGGGSGPGGGWGPACVTADMWVLLESGDYKRAREVTRGDVLAAWKAGDRIAGGKPVLSDPPIKSAPSLRVEADGGVLTCSLSTPFDDRAGGELWGLDIAGREVVTWREHWVHCQAHPIGEREVCYISLGGYAYAAGLEVGRWIVSHNTIIPVKP